MEATRTGHSSRALAVLAAGHLCVDLASGALFALLPFLVAERHYTYAAVGTFALVANVTSGSCQPLFGLSGDRRETRWMLAAGLILAGLGVGVAGLTTHFPLTLLAVVVCMAGVAAYHPEAARLARSTATGRVDARMGFFSLGGGTGYTLGPLLAAGVLAALGLGGTVLIGLVPLVAAVVLTLALRRVHPRAVSGPRRPGDHPAAPSEWRPFSLLIAMFCLSSSVGTGLMIYLPVYLVEARGTSPAAGDVMAGVFMGAGAAGMALGGLIAHRFGRRLVLLVPELVLVPVVFLLPSVSYAAMVPLVALAGLAVMANFSLAIVLGQEYLPAHMGLAAGMVNGFCTAVAGLVLYGLGRLGDAAGPVWVLYVLALLPLGVGALSLWLPRPAAAHADTRWGLRQALRAGR